MKLLFGFAFLFLGIVVKSVSQEVSAAAPRLDQPPSGSEHQTTETVHEPLRRPAPPHSLPRREPRPLRPHGRRLTNHPGQRGSLPRLYNPQERIRKRFREAAQRRFALVRLLPRRRDPLKTAALAPPPLEHVSSPSTEEDGLKDGQASVTAGVLRDTAMAGGQHVAEGPRQQPARLNNSGNFEKDSQISQKLEFQSDLGYNEEDRVFLHPVQVIPGKEERHDNPEGAVVEGPGQHRGLSQGGVTGSGGEKEKASLQVIAFPAAGDGVRGQGVRGGRIAIIHPARFRRFRFRRPNVGVPKLVPKLVPRPISGGGIQQELRHPEGRQEPPPELDLMEDQQGGSLSLASSLPAVGRKVSEKQPLLPTAQAAQTYLPVNTKGSEASLSLSENPQISEGEIGATVGREPLWEDTLDPPRKDVQMELTSEVLTQPNGSEPQEHPAHQEDPNRRPGEAESTGLSQSIKLETASSPIDELPRDLVTTSATSSQTPAVPSSSTDDQGRQPLSGSSPDQQEHMTEFSSHHQLPVRQQEVTEQRIAHRKPDRGQGVPRLRTFVRPRFSQGSQRGFQVQLPRQEPKTQEFLISQSTSRVAPNPGTHDTGLLQPSREGRVLPHSAATLREAAQQPEDQMREPERPVLHHTSPQHGNDRLSDMFAGGDASRTENTPPVQSVTFGVLRRQNEPTSRISSAGQQEDVDQTGHHGIIDTLSRSVQTESPLSTPEDLSGVVEGAADFQQQQQPGKSSSHVTDHQHLPEQHTPYSHTHMEVQRNEAQPRLPQDIKLVSSLPSDASRPFTPTQDAPRAAPRESASARVAGAGSTPVRGRDDTAADDSELAEGVSDASPLCEDHTGSRSGSPPSRGDEGVASTASEGRHTSSGQTLAERVYEEPSESYWPSERMPPSVSPLRSTGEATRTRVSQEPRRAGAGSLQSSRKSDEVTLSGSSDGHINAEAYASHLKTLESELERHVSLLKGQFNLRQRGQSSQRSDGSRLGEQRLNNRQRGASVRGSQSSRLQSTEAADAGSHPSHLGDNVSKTRGSVQSADARNEFRPRDQLSTENELRLRGELLSIPRQPDAGLGRVSYYPTGRFRDVDTQTRPRRPLTPGRSDSRTQRKPSRSRTDGGTIRLRGDHTRSPPSPLSPVNRAGSADGPPFRQQHSLKARRPYPSRQPPSPREGVRAFHSSHDEITTFLDSTAAPKIPLAMTASLPQSPEPRPAVGSLVRATHRFVSSEASPTTLTGQVNHQGERQRHLPVISRPLTDSYGQPAYTFERFPEAGSSKDTLSIQNTNYHASPGRVERLRGSLSISSIHRKKEPTSTQGHPHVAPPRILSTKFPPATLGEAQVTPPEHRFRQQPPGDKSSFLGRVEGPARPVSQRGSKKFMDTLRGMNKDMEEQALLRSLAALLRGQDLSGHWASHDVPRLDAQRPPPHLQIPETGFRCAGLTSGYYADTHAAAQCRSFHFCGADGTQTSYMCPEGTAFNQRLQVCDHDFRVDCNALAYSAHPDPHPPQHRQQQPQHQYQHQQYHHHPQRQQHPRAGDDPRGNKHFGRRDYFSDLYHISQRA
ncbi:filaggrin-2-like [Eriocheir sinensis]|uniref:filaggrin-2-like n=1 Tax=Eriocheir sinensis TaxID=95602 RepID=UPI0021C8C287|nr:filaggrin-2-like [Eriocheir sinensis]